MMEYRPVGWVEPAIPIDAQVYPLLGIAALNPTYELQEAAECIRATGWLSVGCAVRTTPSVDGAHSAPYGGGR